eukprot:TRINITY_DN1234_c3_g1_i1.p1 TRINITY_DN1234_c3_g1~~TRINITY_DN1234_c3_g1_i1.p1  ORF type:complete len:155 (+),score=18.61 TRINITY_DN1234_c3_g1_i1:50-466(+)
MGFAMELEKDNVRVPFAVPLLGCSECSGVCLAAWFCQPCMLGWHQAALDGRESMDWGVCCMSLCMTWYCLSIMVQQRREIRTRYNLEADDVAGTCGGSDTCTMLNWTPCALIQHHRELERQGVPVALSQPGYSPAPEQ